MSRRVSACRRRPARATPTAAAFMRISRRRPGPFLSLWSASAAVRATSRSRARSTPRRCLVASRRGSGWPRTWWSASPPPTESGFAFLPRRRQPRSPTSRRRSRAAVRSSGSPYRSRPKARRSTSPRPAKRATSSTHLFHPRSDYTEEGGSRHDGNRRGGLRGVLRSTSCCSRSERRVRATDGGCRRGRSCAHGTTEARDEQR
jgi:hypothetical protein